MGNIETVLSSSTAAVFWSAFITTGTMWYGSATTPIELFLRAAKPQLLSTLKNMTKIQKSLNLIEEIFEHEFIHSKDDDNSSIDRAVSHGWQTGPACSIEQSVSPMELKSHTASSMRRCSLGISMEDILELTGDDMRTFDSSSSLNVQSTRRKSSKRTSLDLVLSDKNDSVHAYCEPSNENFSGYGMVPPDREQNQTCWKRSRRVSVAASQEELSDSLSSPPFDPSSPNYTSDIAFDYQQYLKDLINCMNRSQQTRRKVDSIKKLMKQYGKSKTTSNLSLNNKKGLSYAAIKQARRKPRLGPGGDDGDNLVSSSSPTATFAPPLTSRRVSRRRSSIAVQAFKMQFFPDSY